MRLGEAMETGEVHHLPTSHDDAPVTALATGA
jgi:hypothetical protein